MLAEQIKKSGKNYSGIYGEPRGGLVVAVRLSYLLNIPFVEGPDYLGSDGLYVDDVVETGETLKFTVEFNNIAVLFWNPSALFEPTFYVSPKVPNSHIIFPWEKIDV